MRAEREACAERFIDAWSLEENHKTDKSLGMNLRTRRKRALVLTFPTVVPIVIVLSALSQAWTNWNVLLILSALLLVVAFHWGAATEKEPKL